RRMHNEELHNLHSSPSIIRTNKSRRMRDNNKMDLREIGWDGMDWIDLAQDGNQWSALMNTVINLRLP
ncbi:hypothetical protein B7P43_G06219, partial [Cryptotermes secundus]